MRQHIRRGGQFESSRLAVLVGAALALCFTACSPPAAAAGLVIGEGVQAQIETAGEARVIINLRDTAPAQATNAERQAAVKQEQDAVLQALPPGAFELVRRYDSIPALAGTLTADGLTILPTLPQVMSVQLDSAGGATGG
jgi:hypothetical protein